MDKNTIKLLNNQAFDKQKEVFRAARTIKRIALHVGRRGGKSKTLVILYLMYALMHDNIRLVYIGLTGEGAENAFYPHAIKCLQAIDFKENVDYTYNKTERLLTFLSTGSTISLKGWDTSYKEMDKLLGGNCFSVAIDECQSQTQDLEKAILYKIQAAVSDYLPIGGGSIFCLGTSGDYMGSNLWYQICSSPNHLGWTYFTWLDKENPFMLEAKTIEDKQFIEMYGSDFEELDWYKQQYQNKWITSGKRAVYQMDNRNLIGLPECIDPITQLSYQRPSAQFLQTALYGLGMDWGFSPDPMSFLVVAYNLQFSNKMYVIYEHKQTEMFVPDIDKKIRDLNYEYHFSFMVADAGALAKGQVADLNQNYHWSILEADKSGKLAHQNTINGDLRAQQILIDPIACPQLVNEMQNLIWDPIKLNTENKRVEKEGLANHLCDALLYAHHHCRHSWYKAPIPKFEPKTAQEAAQHFNREVMQQLMQRNKSQPVSNSQFATPHMTPKFTSASPMRRFNGR